jgi:hypothetical protein
MMKREPEYFGQQRFTDKYAREKAEMFGCVIEYADACTLQLDIDSDDLSQMWEQLDLLEELGIVPLALTESGGLDPLVRTSKSNNQHVTVRLAEPLPIERRILLQALLGSDIKREMLAFAGHLRGQKRPVLLFRPKENRDGEAAI